MVLAASFTCGNDDAGKRILLPLPSTPRGGPLPCAAAWAAMANSCKDQGSAGHCWEGEDATEPRLTPGLWWQVSWRAGSHSWRLSGEEPCAPTPRNQAGLCKRK